MFISTFVSTHLHQEHVVGMKSLKRGTLFTFCHFKKESKKKQIKLNQ